MIDFNLNKDNWKQINYRKVNTIIAAEFIHELYNRYYPNINSIRFRNTLVYFKKGTVYTYAPKEEWDTLLFWFGQKFLAGDSQLYEAIDNLINYKKPILKHFLTKLKSENLKSVSGIKLGLYLIDLQYFALGEIYRVNLVQIEHALNYAVDEELKSLVSEKDYEQMKSILITAEKPTFATREEIDLYKVSKKLKSMETNKHAQMAKDFAKEFYHKYGYAHSAYGTSPYNTEYYENKILDIASLPITEIKQKIVSINTEHKRKLSEKLRYLKLISTNKILETNLNLMSKVGTLRDNNKVLLGYTNEYREKILVEIAQRVNIDDISLYTLGEILEALRSDKKIDNKTLTKRREGFVIKRQEYFTFDRINFNEGHYKKDITELTGTCASNGIATGVVKIIRTQEDCLKMEKGDVMVAPGTDFDLIDAMYKASAIITEEGGLLSHASVVCREIGTPCLISVKNATKYLKDGQKVHVDATNSKIKIILK